jgi:hypothetical protein
MLSSFTVALQWTFLIKNFYVGPFSQFILGNIPVIVRLDSLHADIIKAQKKQ